MTDGEEHREIERIQSLPLDERADAYRALQRELQDRLERPARTQGG